MEFLRTTAAWFSEHEAVAWWLGSASVATLLAVMVLLPVVVTRIPADYFVDRTRHPVPWSRQHPVVRWALLTVKTSLGLVFVVAGLAMLLLPGQGVLTILMGLTLMSFPGKFAVERSIVRLSPVARSVNWIRRRAGKPPLVIPRAGEPPEDGRT